MTNREFYKTILTTDVADDIKAFAQNELDKLDARNAKRRNTQTKEQKENEERKGAIVKYLGTTKRALAATISQATGFSTQRVSALCRQLVEDGVLTVEDVKVKGKGALKAYSLAE